MASLKFIMDVNDDHPPPIKRDQGANKPANASQLREAPTNSQAHPRHATSPGLATEQDINQAAPAAQTKRRGASSRGPKSAAPTTSEDRPRSGAGAAPSISSPSSSSPSLSAPTSRQSTRRRSTASNDSMEPARYGSAALSSSMRGGPQRPMPLHPTASHLPARITPKTGRVSKAQKGLPVHVCIDCSPPKVRFPPSLHSMLRAKLTTTDLHSG
jgi:hypothetical protein